MTKVRLLAALGALITGVVVLAQGPVSSTDDDVVVQLRSTSAPVTPVTVDLTCTADALGLAELSTKVGPAHRVITLFEGTDDDVAAIRAQLAEDFAPFVRDGQAFVPACLNLITARKA